MMAPRLMKITSMMQTTPVKVQDFRKTSRDVAVAPVIPRSGCSLQNPVLMLYFLVLTPTSQSLMSVTFIHSCSFDSFAHWLMLLVAIISQLSWMQRRNSDDNPRTINRQLPIRIFCFPHALTLSLCVWIIKVLQKVSALRNSAALSMLVLLWTRCFLSFKSLPRLPMVPLRLPLFIKALKRVYHIMDGESRLTIRKAPPHTKKADQGEIPTTVLGTLGMFRRLSYYSEDSIHFPDHKLFIKR